jgi:four helix bundle protein
MKKKTPNAQRRTPNIEFGACRLAEGSDGEYESKRKPVYDLEDRLREFAARIVELTESLPNTRAGNHIAGQLLRCGTSSFSNHGEVEAAESRRDFLHKLRICLKEPRETKRWLRLVGRIKKLGSPANFTVCLNEIDALIRIFVASIRTAREERQVMCIPSKFYVACWTLDAGCCLAFPLGVGRSVFGVRRFVF